VTHFEILGRVTARQSDWAADLTPQQQRLLAVLVMAGGAAVGRRRLEGVLWDFKEPYPAHGLKGVASELRHRLRRAPSDDDPVPADGGGYRLLVTQEEADVLRFRAKMAAAEDASGSERLERMLGAVREWGPGAGLHGGEPLLGLDGQWADSTRHKLKTDYRKAVFYCLTQGISLHRYEFVLRQCEQIDSDDIMALLDEQFVTLWMSAAGHAGDQAKAREVYQRAVEAAARVGKRPPLSLHSLDAQLRANGPRPERSPVPESPETGPAPVPADSRTLNVTAYYGNAFGAFGDIHQHETDGKRLRDPHLERYAKPPTMCTMGTLA
jgi:DNA-binding SARP family transcriptional activator